MKLKVRFKKNKRSKARHRTVNIDINRVLKEHDNTYTRRYTVQQLANAIRWAYEKYPNEMVCSNDAEKAAKELYDGLKLLNLA